VYQLTEAVAIPKPLIKELYEYLVGIEEILATIEELVDEESLKRIKKSLTEYKKREYVTAKNSKAVRKVLMKS